MPSVVTINRADVVALIERVAAKYTEGNKTAAVAMALKKLLEQDDRSVPLFGALRGTAWMDPNFDLTTPVFQDPLDAETTPWAAVLEARPTEPRRRGRQRSAPRR